MEHLISEIVELCYQQKKDQAYEKINQFIGEMAKMITSYPAEKVAEINEVLRNILAAMEDNDIVAVADLLEYELKNKLMTALGQGVKSL